MANVIRISPNALRASADRHMTVTATVDEATARISNLVNELNAAWDGGASNEALETLRSIREDIADIGQGTSGSANRLKSIAEAFEALDESGNGGIGGAIIGVVEPILAKVSKLIVPVVRPAFNWFVPAALRIVPDEVRQVAAQCRQVADELRATAQQLNEMVQSLASEWEGKSYNRFAADTRDMVVAFRNASERLDDLADTIAKAADRYEALDNSLA